MTKRILKTSGVVFFLLLLIIIIVFSGLKTFLDQREIKSLVKDTIQTFLQLDVDYGEISTIVLPQPGLKIQGLLIHDGELKICKIDEVFISFDLLALFEREFSIRSVSLKDGNLVIEREIDGQFSLASKFKSDAKEIQEGREKIEEGPKALFQFLPKHVFLDKIEIVYIDNYLQAKNKLTVDSLEIFFDKKDLATQILLEASLNENHFALESNTFLTQDQWSIESLHTKTSFSANHFEPRKMSDLFKVFTHGDTEGSSLDLALSLKKESPDKLQINIEKLTWKGLKTKKGFLIPELSVSTSLNLLLNESKVKLEKLSIGNGNHTELRISGYVNFQEPKTIALKVESEKFDLDKLQPVVDVLSKIEINQSPYFKQKIATQVSAKQAKIQHPLLDIALDMRKMKIAGQSISFLRGPVLYRENLLSFDGLSVGIFDGKVLTTGNLILSTGQLHAQAYLSSINVEKAILSGTSDQLLKGTLRSDLVVDLNTKSKQPIMNQLNLKSKFHIENGYLLGYANFVRPLAEIGKLLNFDGAKGESTEFESIDGEVAIAGGRTTLRQFQMKGVGLNASGAGIYSEDGKIDMKFTVGLSGMVGKAVKLPIIYKGFYGQNLAYIDPVWLASVYAGTLMGGPAGTALGSIMGTKASDNVDKTINYAKDRLDDISGFFFGKKRLDEKEPSSKK